MIKISNKGYKNVRKEKIYKPVIEQLKTKTEYDSFGNLVVTTYNPTNTDIPNLAIKYTEDYKSTIYLPRYTSHAHLFEKSNGIPDDIEHTIKYTYEPKRYAVMFNGRSKVKITKKLTLDSNNKKIINGSVMFEKKSSIAKEETYLRGVLLMRDRKGNLINANSMDVNLVNEFGAGIHFTAESKDILTDIPETEFIYTAHYTR